MYRRSTRTKAWSGNRCSFLSFPRNCCFSFQNKVRYQEDYRHRSCFPVIPPLFSNFYQAWLVPSSEASNYINTLKLIEHILPSLDRLHLICYQPITSSFPIPISKLFPKSKMGTSRIKAESLPNRPSQKPTRNTSKAQLPNWAARRRARKSSRRRNWTWKEVVGIQTASHEKDNITASGHPFDTSLDLYHQAVYLEKQGLVNQKTVDDAWARVLDARKIGRYAPAEPYRSPLRQTHGFLVDRKPNLTSVALPLSPSENRSDSEVSAPAVKQVKLEPASSDGPMPSSSKATPPGPDTEHVLDPVLSPVEFQSPVSRNIRDLRPPAEHEIYTLKSANAPCGRIDITKHMIPEPVQGSRGARLAPMTRLSKRKSHHFTYKPRFEVYLGDTSTSRRSTGGQTVLYEIQWYSRTITSEQRNALPANPVLSLKSLDL
jgi:hypothetical protein